MSLSLTFTNSALIYTIILLWEKAVVKNLREIHRKHSQWTVNFLAKLLSCSKHFQINFFLEHLWGAVSAYRFSFSTFIAPRSLMKRNGLRLYRISYWRCSTKRAVLKNFAIFRGKHLCMSLFLKKLQAWRPATLLKRDSNTGAFPLNIANFLKTLFWRTSANACFWLYGVIYCHWQISDPRVYQIRS